MDTWRGAVDAVLAGAVPDAVESAILEFKRRGRSRDDTTKDLAEAAACFVNARGGTVIVGVQDRVGARRTRRYGPRR